MQSKDLTNELYRVYEWTDPISGNRIVYQIDNPVSLCVGKTTHRVTDSDGIVHCFPSIGYFGCALYWDNKEAKIKKEKVRPRVDVEEWEEDEE